MKGIYVIAIAFLASCTVIAANKDFNQDQFEHFISKLRDDDDDYVDDIPKVCPYREKDNHTTTNLAHETDCTKFYKCDHGHGVLQLCPLMIPGNPEKRLHYNRLEQVCDWPWRAGCETCLEEDINGRCPKHRISHEKDNCNLYYHCENCKKTEKRCEKKDECFSRTCQRCVKNREGGRCDKKDPGPGCTHNGKRYKEGDRRIHECNCAKYYVCDGNERWYVKDCEPGFHFNDKTKQCDIPTNAKCPYL